MKNLKALKITTLIFSFLCLIPAPHMFPFPIILIEFIEPSSALLMIFGQVLMIYGIVKIDNIIIWITGFLLSGVGYIITIAEQYPYYEYVLKNPLELLLFVGPFFITGVVTTIASVRKKTLHNKE